MFYVETCLEQSAYCIKIQQCAMLFLHKVEKMQQWIKVSHLTMHQTISLTD